MQKKLISSSEADTARFAKQLSLIAKLGDVFALYGTLGMGKSVFARAFIQNLTEAEDVPSPTFTLVQEYSAPAFDIYHFDLYRLKSPDEVFELGFEEAVYGGVCLIEWPEKAENWLPKNCIKIEIAAQDNDRVFTITFPDNQASRWESVL